MTERDHFFDNFKVLLIFMTVFAHYLRMNGSFHEGSFAGFVYITAFSFIMQGWLFVSGYFSHNLDKCRRSAFRSFLLPYMIFMPVMSLIRLMLFGHAALNYLVPSVALWYLLAMFVYRFAIKDLARIRTSVLLPLTAALFFAAGEIPFLGRELALGRLFSFLVFFVAGFVFRPEYIRKIREMHWAVGAAVLTLLLTYSFLFSYIRPFPVTILHMRQSYSAFGLDPLQGVLARLVTGAAALLWIFVLIRFIPEKKYFFTGIGSRTITVYILHIPLRYVLQRYSILGGGPFSSFLIFFLSAAVVFVFSRPAVKKSYDYVLNYIYKLMLKCVTMFR